MSDNRYLKLCSVFNYVELCYLEDAVNTYSSQTNSLKDPLVKKLIETILTARHYSHQISKGDRNDS